jgi:glycopeptide antibiotics resistance protein
MPLSGPRPPARRWLITAAIAAVIAYGSLYPFQFRTPMSGIGPVSTFLATWNERPGRGDFLANILLYLPLGFFCLLGSERGSRLAPRLTIVVLAGAMLSLSIELTQYYDEGRVTSATDFYSNTLGTFFGGLAALTIGAGFRLPFVGAVSARPVPTMLVLAWLAYRLYPYVPTIDLHKYWRALKPVVLMPSLSAYDLFRQTAVFLSLYALIEAVVRGRRSAYVGLLFAIGVMLAKVMVVDGELRLAEPAGATVAWAIWLILLRLSERVQMGTAGTLLCAYVIALRLEPFHFAATGHAFIWVPFLGVMQGSLVVDTLSFLEKFFLYGTTLYLLASSFGRRLPVTIFVAALLFATSWAETRLPNRSAEVTDALMVLIIALIFALMPPEVAARPSAQPPRPRGPAEDGVDPVPLQRDDDAPRLGWRERVATRRAARRNAIGDIEHY